jgi:hypothetical protein
VDAPRASIADVLPQPKAVRFGGARVITAVLPSGRNAWFQLRPSPAPLSAVRRLARHSAVEDTRQLLTNRDDALAIKHQARTSAADARRVIGDRLRDERQTLRSLAERDAKIDKALAAAGKKTRAEMKKGTDELLLAVQKLRRRDLWDNLTLVSSAPLFAAYGRQGSPFAENNVTLWISLLVWLVGEDVAEFLTGEKSIEGGILRDVDIWAYVSPFANLLTGWWLLSDSQRERYVSGVASSFSVASGHHPPPFVDVYTATIDVAGTIIASDYAPYFASFSNVPVVATITSMTQNPAFEGTISIDPVIASVSGGVLTIVVVVTGFDQGPSPKPVVGPPEPSSSCRLPVRPRPCRLPVRPHPCRLPFTNGTAPSAPS